MIKAGARPAGWSGRREPHRAGNNAPPGGAAIRAPARTAPRRMLPRIACSGFSFHDKCCSARRRRRAFPPSAAPAPCGSNRGALWRERACWTVRGRWRGNDPAKHIATIHAHGQDSGREGDGQAGMDATGRRRACACCWARAAPMPTRPGRARRRSSPRRRRRPPCCAARRRGRAGRNGSFFLPTTARCATMLTAGAHAPRRFPAAGVRFGAHIPFRRNDGTGRRDGLKIRW